MRSRHHYLRRSLAESLYRLYTLQLSACLQQLPDRGGALESEEAFAEQQEEAEERAGPALVPPPVQLRCTLELLNTGGERQCHMNLHLRQLSA